MVGSRAAAESRRKKSPERRALAFLRVFFLIVLVCFWFVLVCFKVFFLSVGLVFFASFVCFDLF